MVHAALPCSNLGVGRISGRLGPCVRSGSGNPSGGPKLGLGAGLTFERGGGVLGSELRIALALPCFLGLAALLEQPGGYLVNLEAPAECGPAPGEIGATNVDTGIAVITRCTVQASLIVRPDPW